jgi:hypothetical protein
VDVQVEPPASSVAAAGVCRLARILGRFRPVASASHLPSRDACAASAGRTAS